MQVVNVAPEAGGAGVAEVTAYLNGCFMPKVGARSTAVHMCQVLGAFANPPINFLPTVCHPPSCPTPHSLLCQILNIRTFAVKFLSAATAVGSGLPVGPEGPMIHMGAAVGAGLSQGHSTTLGIDSGLFRRFQVCGL